MRKNELRESSMNERMRGKSRKKDEKKVSPEERDKYAGTLSLSVIRLAGEKSSRDSGLYYLSTSCSTYNN